MLRFQMKIRNSENVLIMKSNNTFIKLYCKGDTMIVHDISCILFVFTWSFLLRLAVFVLQNEAHGHVDVVNEEQHRLGREITRRF